MKGQVAAGTYAKAGRSIRLPGIYKAELREGRTAAFYRPLSVAPAGTARLDKWTIRSYFTIMAAGRPLKFDPDAALEAAMQLFWRKGYDSSSLQDLLAVTGLSKSSFYQAFKSKHNIFQLSIRRYRKMLTDGLRTQLKHTESGMDFLKNLFHGVAAETCGPDARRGCLLMNTANEFAQTDAEIAWLVGNSIDNLTDIFERAIGLAQKQGDIPLSKDARTLAIYLVSSMSGMKNMVKAGADRETIRRIADTALSTLQ